MFEHYPIILSSLLGYKNSFLFGRTYTSASTASLAKEEEVRGKGIGLLSAVEDQHGGVIVNMEEPMDSLVFASQLEASLRQWREQVDF